MKDKFKEKTFEDIGDSLMDYLEKNYTSHVDEDSLRKSLKVLKKEIEKQRYKDRCRRVIKIF